jgi:hypothetical protein
MDDVMQTSLQHRMGFRAGLGDAQCPSLQQLLGEADAADPCQAALATSTSTPDAATASVVLPYFGAFTPAAATNVLAQQTGMTSAVSGGMSTWMLAAIAIGFILIAQGGRR